MIAPKYSYVSRGKLVTFFRNGDSHTKGLQTSVSGRHFVSYQTLLNWLDEKVPVNNGVKHILRIPDGFLISDVAQFQSGGNYAVSNNRHFIKANYRVIKSDGLKRRDVIAPKNTSSDDFFDGRQKRSGNKMGSVYRSTPNLKNDNMGSKQNSYEDDSNKNNDDFLNSSNNSYSNKNKKDFLNNRNNTNETSAKSNYNDENHYDNKKNNNDYFNNSNNKLRNTESRAGSQQEKQTFVAVNTPQHHNNVEPIYNNNHNNFHNNNNDNNSNFNYHNNNNHMNNNNNNNNNMSKGDNKARIIELVSNSNRKLKQRVIYNPRSHQSINEVYRDIENNILPISNPPVSALYTAYPPYIKVNSLSHLCEELSTHEKFIVCGSEGIPVELNNNNNNNSNNNIHYNNNSFGYNNRYSESTHDNIQYNNNNNNNNVYNNNNNNNNQGSHFSARGFPTCNEKYCTCKLHVALVKALNNQQQQ